MAYWPRRKAMVEQNAGILALRTEIDAFYQGFGDPTALQKAYRAAVLVVPLAAGDRIRISTYAGMEWICAFTGVEEYGRWLSRRDELQPDIDYPYHTLSGWRLADYAAGSPKPTGVTVDIAGSAPMVFPPTVAESADSGGGAR
ncbi:hypothetical protein ACWIGI_22920 [Nocardia sp. NPDC055321]